MANKSALNLYCQKNKLLIPIYNTEYYDGPPHKQTFKSSLEIYDQKFITINSSKQLAENDVAGLAMQFLSTIPPEPKEKKEKKVLDIKKIIEITTAKTIIMIDGDNLDIPNMEYDTCIESLFLIFVAKNNTRMKIRTSAARSFVTWSAASARRAGPRRFPGFAERAAGRSIPLRGGTRLRSGRRARQRSAEPE